ncbi:LysR family transcriptional regulator [Pseudomonas arsenicoxydans]|uniref:LysR family transcriptional regulator n=1 Tax=Pseudomonas arsenicoxydans TaxID=702115 RepID=A0A502HXX2_9PSED|nr:LysR family transcriptional regulator [Pseudomonas arsenicoxydans]TPG79597.1 LysR family transcriptional regulator [Pseudomonas arsenicoxydans]
MRYRRLDLNLLVALDALLSECSVSRAAERLCLGQSAASSALGRLREHFNDPLLVQVGRRLEPTALGLELLPKVRQALALTREIVDAPVNFEPANCTRHFTVVASDYVAGVLLPAVSLELARIAPRVRLSLRDMPVPRDGDVVSEALDYRRSDCVIVPQRRLNPAYPHIPLMSDQLCCIVCARQPQFADGLSLTDYCEAEHVVREFADGRNLAMDAVHLQELGVHRRVAVALESFVLMPEFIVGTARIATVFRRQAQRFAQHYPLRIHPTPLAFPEAVQVLQWHPYQDHDPAMLWFRGLLLEQGALLDQQGN